LLEHLTFAGRMLFVPFFFIHTGMLLELEVFAEVQTWAMAGLLAVAVLGGKTAAAWLTGHRFGFGRTDRLAMAGLTVPQAAATLAVITTAEGAGLVDDSVVDAVILVIFVTCLTGALVTRTAARKLSGEDDERDDTPPAGPTRHS
jgi:Kef-type K+ transport system membrane component KefB